MLHINAKKIKTMKRIHLYLTMLTLSVLLVSCSEDKLDPNSVIHEPILTENALDKWLMLNYVIPYNIDLVYRKVDNDLPVGYNLTPACFEKSAQLAQVFKFLSILPYDSVTGSKEFVRYAFPKFINFVGSGAYNNNGTMILGTAEDGIKVVMYDVNSWESDLSKIDTNSFYPMNSTGNAIRYFHTLHHELAHILHQRRPYPASFRLISQGRHTQDDWSNAFVSDSAARRSGFITTYASKDPDEDIAELFSVFISATPTWWEMAMQQGVVPADPDTTPPTPEDRSAREAMESKLNILYEYTLNEWGVCMIELRRVIIEQKNRLPTLPLNLD
jgi:substrate import-associated zinc metallohydrolase lipoprotein